MARLNQRHCLCRKHKQSKGKEWIKEKAQGEVKFFEILEKENQIKI
jgi:hypothetical protein